MLTNNPLSRAVDLKGKDERGITVFNLGYLFKTLVSIISASGNAASPIQTRSSPEGCINRALAMQFAAHRLRLSPISPITEERYKRNLNLRPPCEEPPPPLSGHIRLRPALHLSHQQRAVLPRGCWSSRHSRNTPGCLSA